MAGLLFVSVLAAGCEQGHPGYFGTVKPRHGPEEIWINNGTEPEWIDPGKCSDSSGSEIIFNTFAGLLQPHPHTLEPMPDVADRWTISQDQRSYTFHLRETHWSDGRPVTAQDFEWSWKRVLDPKTASKYGSLMYLIQNAAPFHQQALLVTGLKPPISADTVQAAFEAVVPVEKVTVSHDPAGAFVFVGAGEGVSEDAVAARIAENRKQAVKAFDGGTIAGSVVKVRVADSSVVGVKALDDHTLRVQLKDPVPYFKYLLSFYTFMPVPRHVIEQLEADGTDPLLWTRPEHFVSNGPYVLKQWRFRYYMLMEKNPYYWDADNVRLQRVKLYEVESYNTVVNLYSAGEIDWIGSNTSLPSEFMETLGQYRDFHRSPFLATYFYWFNTKKPPLDNVKLRKALSLAIDREAIVKYVTRSGQIPSADLVPDGLAGYEGRHSPIFDPDRARELLHEAGYADGSQVPPITLTYNTSEGHKKVAEAVQQMWKKNLGINVEIENQEWNVFLTNLPMMNFEIARMGWVGDYPDPNTFLQELLTSYAGNNHSGWSSPRYDALIDRANSTSDPRKRLRLLRQAEDLAMDQQPLIPIYVYTRSYLIKPYLRGFWPNYQDRHPFKWMWIDERFYEGVPDQIGDDPPPPEPVPFEKAAVRKE